jgi:hypothetical protein
MNITAPHFMLFIASEMCQIWVNLAVVKQSCFLALVTACSDAAVLRRE